MVTHREYNLEKEEMIKMIFAKCFIMTDCSQSLTFLATRMGGDC